MSSSGYRGLLTRFHDRGSYLACLTQLPVEVENVGQAFLGGLFYQFGCREGRIAVHAHVEFPLFPPERESALRIVEMVERDTEVCQYAVHGLRAVKTEEVAEVSEIAVHEGERGVRGECLVGLGAPDGVHVLVERQQPSATRFGQSPEYASRVSSPSEGAVYVYA